jgi:probable HAF family extracellular repeat protein
MVVDVAVSAGECNGTGINNSGVVVGACEPPGQPRTAFVWDGTRHDLPYYLGNGTAARAINDSGIIVGQVDLPGGNRLAFRYDGSYQILPALPGASTNDENNANDINNSGVIIGEGRSSGNIHAFAYDGTMHDLGTLGGIGSNGIGINSVGIAVGGANTASGDVHAFSCGPIYFPGCMVDLGVPGEAQKINDSGKVVGRFEDAGIHHQFLWDGSFHDLGGLGGNCNSATDINAAGVIVGYGSKTGCDLRATIWTASEGLMDLNDLIDPSSGWFLYVATGINDRGQIVGSAFLNGGTRHAVLLEPIQEPEPASGLLLIGGLTALYFYQRRNKSYRRAEATVG